MSDDGVRVDVAVIGGGGMGLWLSDQLLRHDYTVALFEKDALGGGQTGHSHAYLHRGHLYNDLKLIDQLRGVWRSWEQHMDTEAGRKVTRFDVPARFVFFDAAAAKDKHDLWTSGGLEVQEDEIPHWLARMGARACYRTDEVCVEIPSLARSLAGDWDRDKAHTRRIDRVVGFERDGDGIGALTVAAAGQTLRVEAAFLVICAGAGNAELMEMLPFPAFTPAVRYSYMLAIEHPELPPFAGVFPDREGLFVAPREGEHGTVWILSDRNSSPRRFCREWLDSLLPNLARVVHGLEARREEYRWGVYEAPKSELKPEGVTQGFGVEDLGTRNVRVVWPLKLTLAPKVTDHLIRDAVEPTLKGAPQSAPLGEQAAWKSFSEPPGFARERWDTTPRVDWSTFKQEQGITVW